MLTLLITSGATLWIPVILAVAAVATLCVRRPTPDLSTRRWVAEVVAAVAIGAAVGAVVAMIASWLEVMEDPLPWGIGWIVTGAMAAFGVCVLNLVRGPGGRRILAGVATVLVALAAVLGVNAYLDIDRTLGSLLNVQAYPPVVLPEKDAAAQPVDAATWVSPADLPERGRVGSAVIPASGFEPRAAGIYLPPAALVDDPPALPFMIFMFGDPGVPDPTIIAEVMDDFAADRDGLAPIVIVADQLGTTGQNPLCANSPVGDARAYILDEVPAWARAHLNIVDEPSGWIVAGYSNGGGCASEYAAQRPDMFHTLVSLSGVLYPGSSDPEAAIADVYGGDRAAFEADKPTTVLADRAGTYPTGMTAVFTYGSEDPRFGPAAVELAAAADAAGITTSLRELAGVEHIRGAVPVGLRTAMEILGPTLFPR